MNFTPFAYWKQGGYDPDAQAFLTATSITDPLTSNAINQLVLDLKSYSLWSAMEAIYPFVGGTATTHKYNLKDPRDLDEAYRIGFTGGWTHSPLKGLIPNGTNTDGNTYYVGSGVDNNVAMSFWSTRLTMDANTAGLLTFGTNGGASTVYAILLNRTGVNIASDMGEDNDIAIFSYSDVPQQGLVVGSRTTSTSNKVYFDGALKTTTTSSNAGTWPARTVRFGDPTSAVYTNQNSIFAHIGDGLSDTQVTNLYTVIEKFQANSLYRVPKGTKTGARLYLDTNSTFSYPGTGSTLFDLTYDSSDASISGPTYVSGTPSYFSFDGVNDTMNVSNSSSFGSASTNQTVSAWVKFDTANTTKTVITRGRDGSGNGWSFSLGINSSNVVGADVITTTPGEIMLSVSGVTSLSVDTWYYISAVWTNGSSLKVYVNGVLENTLSTTRTNLRTSTVYWDIARINTTYSKFDSSHCSVYHRSLTDAELLINFNAMKSIYGY